MSVAHRQCAWAHDLLSELCRFGVQSAVIAPGSRHTPLVLAAHNLAAAGHLKLYDVLDERVAGFMALGLGRVSAASAETDDAVGELRGRPKPNLEVRVSRNTSITSASEGERLSRMSATSVSQTPDRGKRLWRI